MVASGGYSSCGDAFERKRTRQVERGSQALQLAVAVSDILYLCMISLESYVAGLVPREDAAPSAAMWASCYSSAGE